MATTAPESLPFTDEESANRLLAENGLALLVGMLLDQQVKMEQAFKGPWLLQERMGEPLRAEAVANLDPETLEAYFRGPPALHRYPASMGERTQRLTQFVVDEYDGDATRIWTEARDGRDLYKRLLALPGYGKAKAKIFVGLLGKRLSVRPDGWNEAAADWPSIADIDSYDKVEELRATKKATNASAEAGGKKK